MKHCSCCQMTQIRRHRFYDELMFITSLSYSFHIITINFIFVLFDDLNNIFTIIDKYSKRFIFIVDKFTYNVNQWINVILNRLFIIDWNLLVVIISNRNSKFLSNIWQTFFDRFDIKLFIFIIYHSQTNDIFERTN